MLPRKHRMVNAEEYSETLRMGARAGNRYLVVTIAAPQLGAAIVFPDKDRQIPWEAKVGLIVSKKQAARAVDRNWIKRRLRHIMKDELEWLPPGSRIVLRALSPILRLSSDELRNEVHQGIARARRKLAGSQ